ncbi:precorrin-2 dehydrogenase/sirohydrochlorin ferrochelatase family protein [Desulfoscipio geothermicus]|uniref:precorrin-2 dehydrogenase n=1 Tax=Desulfoscipio geothermicus DSM 3669 TaxID=1121426 RepID=A0A1I6DXY0_9FIRM|nr:bifunctional precorrin-2 dehydrogenase/sirohydrochlorin ferrochelatase [Desulfoscipio geothermicus]SFR10191.1 precorrin-2 dehydrogenase [Desulfoscipio geothermicus DSM 3669]
MEFYPVFLNLQGKKCLVVGGGRVAERKVRALVRCGAHVYVVSPVLTAGLQEMLDHGQIIYRRGFYQTADLDGVFLVISATDNEEVNNVVAVDCAGRNILVNVVDDPPRCNFFVPSVVHRGALQLAISTGGKSPHLAKTLRQSLEKEFGPQFAEFVDFLGNVRAEVLDRVTDPSRRKQILKNLTDETTLALVKQGDIEKAKERVKNVYHIHRRQP